MKNENLSNPSQLRVICRKNDADAKNFTDGKIYHAYKEAGKENCNTWIIRDDIGHERVILPDELCPHLMKRFVGFLSGENQVCVGIFETVKES